jgi:hypothetical protein
MRNRDAYLDDDYVVRDGEHVQVPIYAMDAVQRKIAAVAFDASKHQPGYRQVHATDAMAEARRTSAYDGMVRRLQDAWRLRSKDAGQPDNSSSAEVMRRHLRTEPDNNAQDRRDKAWASYKDQLNNAWRSPPGIARSEPAILGSGPRSMVVETDPSRATEIERQAESSQWRHGK